MPHRKSAALAAAVLLSVLSSFVSPRALAQGAATYPNRLVRIVLSVAPGGPTDLFSRMFATHMEKKYGQPFIVDNKPGGGNLIAYHDVIKSPADGYVLAGSSQAMFYDYLLNKEAQYDGRRDLQPVGIFAGTGLFLAVHASVPVSNLREFIAYVKANPGKLNYGTAGRASVEMIELRDRLGLAWEVVNYKGGVAAFTALTTGEVQMYTPDVNQLVPQMQAGKVKGIAYGDRTRHSKVPNVPTFMEQGAGLDDFLFRVWLGINARSGVPADIVAKLNTEIIAVSKTPEATARFDAMGWAAMPLSPAEIRRDVEQDIKRISDLIARGANLSIN